MKNILGNFSLRIRMALLNRQANALLRKANSAYKPSRHLVGYVPPKLSDNHDRPADQPWLIIAIVAAAFLVGAFVRDDNDATLASTDGAQLVSGCTGTRIAAFDQSNVNPR